MKNFLSNVFSFNEKKEIEKEVTVKVIDNLDVKVVEVGSSGTEIYAGYIDEEYIRELQGSKAMKVYDQMRRSDPRIKMVSSAVKNVIKGADYSINTLDDSEEALRQKELIEKILFKGGIGKSWKKNMHEVLSMVDFGYSLQEITHKPVLNDKQFGCYIGLKSLKLIGQKTVEKFNVNKDGTLCSVTQMASGDVGRNVDIPAKFVLHFSIDKEGDNYEGISMLRPCYGPYLRKNNALRQESVGNQNASTPLAVMTVPDGEQNSDQYKNAIRFLELYTKNKSSYLVKPQGYELELTNNPFDSSKIRATVTAENEEIVFAFLANFLNLGSGGAGSYALSNDLSDFFLSSLVFIAGEIVETYNTQLIPQLVALNFANQECLIELAVSGIDDKAGKEFAEVISILTNAKAITTDNKLETFLRNKYSLPVKEATENDEIVESEASRKDPAEIASIIELVKSYSRSEIEREVALKMLVNLYAVEKNIAEELLPVKQVEIVTTPTLTQFAETMKSEKPKDISKRIERNSDTIKKMFRSNLDRIGKKLISDIISKYNDTKETREAFVVFDVKPTGVNAYTQEMIAEFNKIATDAYGDVKKFYKFNERKTKNRAVSKARMLTMTQINDLEKAIYLQFLTSIDSTDSANTLQKDLDDALEKALTNIEVGAEITSAQLENESRMDIFEEFEDEIESFTFFNQDPEAEICKDLNGVTFKVGDPDLERYTPPLHHNCKSVMIPNFKGDKNNPEASGLPSLSAGAIKSITLHEKCCL